MKKRLKKIITSAFLILLSAFFVGCSGSCKYTCYEKLGGCAEDFWDFFGCYFNCYRENNCIPSCVYQTDCYKDFCVDSFYSCGDYCASECRNKGLNELMHSIDKLNKEDYSLDISYEIVNSGEKYYTIEVTLDFTVFVDVKDVVLAVGVSDHKDAGLAQNFARFYLPLGSKMQAGKSVTKTKRVVFAHTKYVSNITVSGLAHGRY